MQKPGHILLKHFNVIASPKSIYTDSKMLYFSE